MWGDGRLDRDGGSFRDPAGYVISGDEQILRAITTAGEADFQAVQSSGFLEDLVQKGILTGYADSAVSTTDFRPAHGHPVVRLIEHPRLPFISYPYEWCFSALKAAALLQLDLLIESVDRGFILKDASAFNVQFVDTRPVFIDHLSFRPYQEGEYWLGHEQFVRQFFSPLLVEWLTGLSPCPWYRGALDGLPSDDVLKILSLVDRLRPAVLLHITLPSWFAKRHRQKEPTTLGKRKLLPRVALQRIFRGLHRSIERLTPPATSGTWSDYATNNSYGTAAADMKKRFVAEAVTSAAPQQLWDLGCNTGDYAFVALEAGAQRVIGLEGDRSAAEEAFRRASSRGACFLPLCVDVLNPTSGAGWRERERGGLTARARPDFVMALALIHHLAFRGNVPLEDIIDWLVGFAPEGVIEFVPKHDPMVVQLLALRSDLFASYDEAHFRQLIGKHARIVREKTLPGSGRLLIQFSRS